MKLASVHCGPDRDTEFRPIFTKSKFIQEMEEAVSRSHCDLYMTKDTWSVIDDDVERYSSAMRLCVDLGIACCAHGSKKGICHHVCCCSLFGFHLVSVIQGCYENDEMCVEAIIRRAIDECEHVLERDNTILMAGDRAYINFLYDLLARHRGKSVIGTARQPHPWKLVEGRGDPMLIDEDSVDEDSAVGSLHRKYKKRMVNQAGAATLYIADIIEEGPVDSDANLGTIQFFREGFREKAVAVAAMFLPETLVCPPEIFDMSANFDTDTAHADWKRVILTSKALLSDRGGLSKAEHGIAIAEMKERIEFFETGFDQLTMRQVIDHI